MSVGYQSEVDLDDHLQRVPNLKVNLRAIHHTDWPWLDEPHEFAVKLKFVLRSCDGDNEVTPAMQGHL